MDTMEPVSLSYPVRRQRRPTDPFFAEGDAYAAHFRKFSLGADELAQIQEYQKLARFKCLIESCRKKFTSLAAFELHYSSAHRYVCATCRHTLPTARLLELHVLEKHDSLFRVMAEKQKMV